MFAGAATTYATGKDEGPEGLLAPTTDFSKLEQGEGKPGGDATSRGSAPELHQLSIRHLAVAAGDTVAFGCQYRGPAEDTPPLIGFHRRGQQPVIVPAPRTRKGNLRNYIGSVMADTSGGIVAASAPKGGLIAYWDVTSRRFLGTCADLPPPTTARAS